jgi:hypothetical protein
MSRGRVGTSIIRLLCSHFSPYAVLCTSIAHCIVTGCFSFSFSLLQFTSLRFTYLLCIFFHAHLLFLHSSSLVAGHFSPAEISLIQPCKPCSRRLTVFVSPGLPRSYRFCPELDPPWWLHHQRPAGVLSVSISGETDSIRSPNYATVIAGQGM